MDLLGVVPGEEAHRRRQHDEVAEGDAADCEDCRQQRQPPHHLGVAAVDRRDEERPHLPDDHRQRDDDPEVDRDPDRRREGLGGAEGVDVAVLLRDQQLEPVDQVNAKNEPDDRTDDDGADADEQALAQLIEVLDERCLLAVVQATRKPWPRHPWHLALRDGLGFALSRSRSRRLFSGRLQRRGGCRDGAGRRRITSGAGATATGGGSSECVSTEGVLVVTESLNSRIPVPSDRPISGNRFAPKRSSSTSRRMIRWSGESES